ncbi:MAG: MBL fold metallo-hydrolase [Pyrinomonadaceae bacterium]
MRVNATRFRSFTFLILALVLLLASLVSAQQAPTAAASKTRIVMLGTGTPGPLPDRSGPATAIVVNDTAYLVDFGPGIVRRASAAFLDKGIKGLEPTKLRVAFVTHLHSDHTVGYPDLIFTPWTVGRRVPLEVYGPKGLKGMTEHLLYHYSSLSPEELIAEMLARYSGHFVIGRDLDIY